MRYALITAGVVVGVYVDASDAWIAANPDAVAVADGVAAAPGYTYSGGTFTAPAAPAVAVPAEVTMRQARLALYGAGLLASVETAIDALPEPTRTAARIEWDYSSTVQRNNTFVATLGAALGLSGGYLDALFIAAHEL